VSAIGVREGRAPRELSGPVLGMVLFVASEAMFFAAFFGAYFTIRTSLDVWPPEGIPRPEIGIPAVLTVLLVSSSVVLQLGLVRMRGSNPRRGTAYLGVAIALGVAFLALQLYDYSQLGFGVKDGVFGTLFYVMTGLHMAHVFGGVVFLSLVFGQAASGLLTRAQHDSFEAGTIYWHFVDVVWICLFTVFYLLTPR
jgi:cytochrome c oxidase subunit III